MKKHTQVYVQAPLKAGFMDTTQISRIYITKVKTKQVHISMWKEEWLQLTFKDEWTSVITITLVHIQLYSDTPFTISDFTSS